MYYDISPEHEAFADHMLSISKSILGKTVINAGSVYSMPEQVGVRQVVESFNNMVKLGFRMTRKEKYLKRACELIIENIDYMTWEKVCSDCEIEARYSNEEY